MSESKCKCRFKAKECGRLILTGLKGFYRWVLRPLGIGLAWPVRKIGLGIGWCFRWLGKLWDKAAWTKPVDRFYATKTMQYVRKTIFVITCVLFWVVLDVLFILGPTLKYVIFPMTNLVMRTELSVDTMVIQPLAGYVHIENLVLQNPRVFKESSDTYIEEPLVKVGTLLVDVGVLSLFTDTITIDEILVTDCTALYAWDCGTNNVNGLLEQMGLLKKEDEAAHDAKVKEEVAEAKKEVEKAEAEGEKPAKHLLIKHLKLNNNDVTLRYHGMVIASFNSFLNVELENATEEDITSKVLGDKFSPIVDAYVFCSENLSKGADFLVSGLSGICSGALDVGAAVGGAVLDAGGATVDGIKAGAGAVINLFGGSSEEKK